MPLIDSSSSVSDKQLKMPHKNEYKAEIGNRENFQVINKDMLQRIIVWNTQDEKSSVLGELAVRMRKYNLDDSKSENGKGRNES